MPNPRSTAPNPYVPTYFPGFGLYWPTARATRAEPGRGKAKLDDLRDHHATRRMPTFTSHSQGALTPVSAASVSSHVSTARAARKAAKAVDAGRGGRKRRKLVSREEAGVDGVNVGDMISGCVASLGSGEGVLVAECSGSGAGDAARADRDVHGYHCNHDEHDELESVSSSSNEASDAPRTSSDNQAERTNHALRTAPYCSATAGSSGVMDDRADSEAAESARAESSTSAESRARSQRPRRQTTRRSSAAPIPTPQATQSLDAPRGRGRPLKKRKRQQLASPKPAHPRAEEVTLVPHGLPPIQTTADPHWLYLFFRFCSERHTMQDKRDAGVPRDKLSEDETMQKSFVGNVYRELDRGSVRVKEEVIGVGDQGVEEVCFRLFLYCGFHEYSTWTTLVSALGHTPRWSTFVVDLPIYERALHIRSFLHRKTLYTSGFQLVPPTRYYGLSLPHYAATLRFVKSLMDSGLPRRLMATRFAVDASHLLQTFPTLGPFLSLGILCYLNDSAGFKWFWRDFASCGPGARGYLQKIFGKGAINSVAAEEAGLRWLRENQWVIWKRLGVDPPYALAIKGIRPGMRCLDIENALCWCHRYVVDYTKNGWKSLADVALPPRTAVWRGRRVKREQDGTAEDDAEDTAQDGELEADEPAWCDREEDVGGSSKAVHKGDYDEIKERLPPTDEGEEVYEVERIVCRKGQRGGKDGLFRVRWKGWAPEDDTWERASSLKGGADEALQEWLDWEETAWRSIDQVKAELPWTRPEGLGEDVKEEQTGGEEAAVDADVDAESERRRARTVRRPRAGTASTTVTLAPTGLAAHEQVSSAAHMPRPSTLTSSRTPPTAAPSDSGTTPTGSNPPTTTTTPASTLITTPAAEEASRMEIDVDAAVKEEPQ